MTHPLSDELQSLSDNDLYNKLEDLNKKYWMTTNEQNRSQIVMLLDDIKLEQENRKIAEKKQENENNNLDNLINIS